MLQLANGFSPSPALQFGFWSHEGLSSQCTMAFWVNWSTIRLDALKSPSKFHLFASKMAPVAEKVEPQKHRGSSQDGAQEPFFVWTSAWWHGAFSKQFGSSEARINQQFLNYTITIHCVMWEQVPQLPKLHNANRCERWPKGRDANEHEA